MRSVAAFFLLLLAALLGGAAAQATQGEPLSASPTPPATAPALASADMDESGRTTSTKATTTTKATSTPKPPPPPPPPPASPPSVPPQPSGSGKPWAARGAGVTQYCESRTIDLSQGILPEELVIENGGSVQIVNDTLELRLRQEPNKGYASAVTILDGPMFFQYGSISAQVRMEPVRGVVYSFILRANGTDEGRDEIDLEVRRRFFFCVAWPRVSEAQATRLRYHDNLD
jgi:hypothetical protein